jgi:hypothetical protein
MPARNVYHDAVVAALKADGWTVTHDPLRLAFGVRKLYVDLGAERGAVGAEKDGRKIAVEVQSFLSPSDVDDLQHAIGQFVLYKLLLAQTDPDRVLYLAVPEDAYTGIFSEPLGQLVITSVPLRLVTIDPTNQRVTRWIS